MEIRSSLPKSDVPCRGTVLRSNRSHALPLLQYGPRRIARCAEIREGRRVYPTAPRPTPPRRGRRMPEHGARGWGRATTARPPGSNRRRGRRMPAERPIRVRRVPSRTATNSRPFARLHAQQHRVLAVLLRASLIALAHIGRRGDLLAADLEDDVAGLEAVLGGRAVGIDIGDDDAVLAAAGDLIGRRKRQAELRHSVPRLARCTVPARRSPAARSAIRRASA